MEIHQLEYVLTVAKHHSFSRAAIELAVTPPSLTQQIKKLEEELGVKLFERTTRTVSLTPAGSEFVTKASNIIAEIYEMNMAIRELINSENGVISIGTNPVIGSYGITDLIALFQKSYPQVKLTFRTAECLDLLSLLYNGEVDVAFLTAFDKLKTGTIPLEAYPLVHDKLVLICSNSHSFASRENIDLIEAANEDLISFSQASGLYIDTIDICKKCGFDPNFKYYAHSLDTCLGFVAAGMGTMLLSSKTAAKNLRPDITVVQLKTTAVRTFFLVLPDKPNMPPVISNFRDFCLQGLTKGILVNGND